MEDLDDKRTLLAESIDSGEFFLSQLRQKITALQARRNTLRASLSTLETEERSLKVKQSKLNGLSISQYVISFSSQHLIPGTSRYSVSWTQSGPISSQPRSCCGNHGLRRKKNANGLRLTLKISSGNAVYQLTPRNIGHEPVIVVVP
jgi:hypothetical protein